MRALLSCRSYQATSVCLRKLLAVCAVMHQRAACLYTALLLSVYSSRRWIIQHSKFSMGLEALPRNLRSQGYCCRRVATKAKRLWLETIGIRQMPFWLALWLGTGAKLKTDEHFDLWAHHGCHGVNTSELLQDNSLYAAMQSLLASLRERGCHYGAAVILHSF